MTGRKVKEWVGKTPDSPVPPRVRLRVFDAYEGKCYISGRKISPSDKWELDHIVALANGGENRESNLAPALASEHRAKTSQDVAMKSKDRRVRAKHTGAKPPSRNPLPGSRASGVKKMPDGRVIDRDTGKQIWPRID